MDTLTTCMSLTNRIIAKAVSKPNDLAIICNDTSLTYHQLYSSSLQLADELRKIGLKDEEPVAICSGRNIEFVILLGKLSIC